MTSLQERRNRRRWRRRRHEDDVGHAGERLAANGSTAHHRPTGSHTLEKCRGVGDTRAMEVNYDRPADERHEVAALHSRDAQDDRRELSERVLVIVVSEAYAEQCAGSRAALGCGPLERLRKLARLERPKLPLGDAALER